VASDRSLWFSNCAYAPDAITTLTPAAHSAVIPRIIMAAFSP
jgi:hypothetical protein